MCVYVCVRSEDNQFLECLEYEQKTECKPTFSAVIKDVEVVEGSAARFDCKIEGTRAETVDRSVGQRNIRKKGKMPVFHLKVVRFDFNSSCKCQKLQAQKSSSRAFSHLSWSCSFAMEMA